MEIFVYVNENGTPEGECDFRAIDLCKEDEKTLFVMLGHSIGDGNKFEKVYILSEYEYRKLTKFRDTHPDYIKYMKAKEIVKEFEARINIIGE